MCLASIETDHVDHVSRDGVCSVPRLVRFGAEEDGGAVSIPDENCLRVIPPQSSKNQNQDNGVEARDYNFDYVYSSELEDEDVCGSPESLTEGLSLCSRSLQNSRDPGLRRRPETPLRRTHLCKSIPQTFVFFL